MDATVERLCFDFDRRLFHQTRDRASSAQSAAQHAAEQLRQHWREQRALWERTQAERDSRSLSLRAHNALAVRQLTEIEALERVHGCSQTLRRIDSLCRQSSQPRLIDTARSLAKCNLRVWQLWRERQHRFHAPQPSDRAAEQPSFQRWMDKACSLDWLLFCEFRRLSEPRSQRVFRECVAQAKLNQWLHSHCARSEPRRRGGSEHTSSERSSRHSVRREQSPVQVSALISRLCRPLKKQPWRGRAVPSPRVSSVSRTRQVLNSIDSSSQLSVFDRLSGPPMRTRRNQHSAVRERSEEPSSGALSSSTLLLLFAVLRPPRV